MRWQVLYVRPKSEKKIGEFCKVLGITHYLPLRSETKIYQRRKVVVHKPVFPCYFFLKLNDTFRLDILKTNLVIRILKPSTDRQLLHELAQVRKALRADPGLVACKALKRGHRVRITGGPFLGIEGIVSRMKSTNKVVLNVEIIGRAVSVESDLEFLELAEDEPKSAPKKR